MAGELSGTLRAEWSEDLAEWHVLDVPPVQALPVTLRDERPVSAQHRYDRVVVEP